MDAFSDGQVGSKLWLCEQLENEVSNKKLKTDTIWIFGSWYATLPFLLFSRGKLDISNLACFDTDPKANKVATKILNHWIYLGRDIKIHQMDCGKIYATGSTFVGKSPDFLINTSCEHMANYDWWHQMPPGTNFALQSTNMPHATHSNSVKSLSEFRKLIQPSELFYESTLEFRYPNLKFDRFMLIGRKS